MLATARYSRGLILKTRNLTSKEAAMFGRIMCFFGFHRMGEEKRYQCPAFVDFGWFREDATNVIDCCEKCGHKTRSLLLPPSEKRYWTESVDN